MLIYPDQHPAGFTLIEVLIYIALFTIIIGGGIVTAFQIFQGSEQVRAIAERETELNFLLRKIDWALGTASAVEVPAPETLRVHDRGVVYEFSSDTDRVFMNVSTGPRAGRHELTSSRIKVTALDFAITRGTNDMLRIELTIDDERIGPIKRYLR